MDAGRRLDSDDASSSTPFVLSRSERRDLFSRLSFLADWRNVCCCETAQQCEDVLKKKQRVRFRKTPWALPAQEPKNKIARFLTARKVVKGVNIIRLPRYCVRSAHVNYFPKVYGDCVALAYSALLSQSCTGCRALSVCREKDDDFGEKQSKQELVSVSRVLCILFFCPS